MAADALIAWSDEIECEGGPVLVANAEDFAHWFGNAGELGHEAVRAFGPGCTGYLWNAIPGSVRVTVDAGRAALWLTQIEYAEDDAGRAAALACALAFDGLQEAPGMHYRVTKGPLVVAWAANSVSNTSTSIARLPLAGDSPGALIDFAGGPNAAALWLAPGVYASSLFFHEEDRWGISRCRLLRLSD